MRLLVDTQLLIWYAQGSPRMASSTRATLDDRANELFFSVTSLWEIAIKRGLGRDDFRVEPRALRRGLLANGYEELSITADHAFAVDTLPPLHKDPFDRLLIAQATVEGMILLTADKIVACYPGPILHVHAG